METKESDPESTPPEPAILYRSGATLTSLGGKLYATKGMGTPGILELLASSGDGRSRMQGLSPAPQIVRT